MYFYHGTKFCINEPPIVHTRVNLSPLENSCKSKLKSLCMENTFLNRIQGSKVSPNLPMKLLRPIPILDRLFLLTHIGPKLNPCGTQAFHDSRGAKAYMGSIRPRRHPDPAGPFPWYTVFTPDPQARYGAPTRRQTRHKWAEGWARGHGLSPSRVE